MKTNFFTELLKTGIKSATIEIKIADDGKMVVLTTPKTTAQDSGLKSIKPLIMTYTPEELDEGYFEAILIPLQKTSEVFNNVENYEAQLEEAKKNTDLANKSKSDEKNKKDKVKKLEDSAKKYIESLKEPRHWEQREEKVLNIISEILELDKENKYAAKIKKELADNKAKAGAVGLFSEPAAEHIEPELPKEEPQEEESDDNDSEEENEEETE